MAKKVKFPLKMSDGALVKDLEGLREHFDIESILGYYTNGKLKEWLENFYYESEAEQLSDLDTSAPDFKIRLCELLGVACPEDMAIDMDKIVERNARIVQLKQFTANDEIIANIDRVAFSQEDLANLLDEDTDTVYLCGASFTVPVRKESVTYIGVNRPVVNISSKEIIDFDAKNIVFKDIVFCESYQKILEQQNPQKEHIVKSGTELVKSEGFKYPLDGLTEDEILRILNNPETRGRVDINNMLLSTCNTNKVSGDFEHYYKKFCKSARLVEGDVNSVYKQVVAAMADPAKAQDIENIVRQIITNDSKAFGAIWNQ